MSKKVIGALLALALVLSVFSFTVLAAGTGYETDASFTQTWKLANKQGSGGTYTVDVYLTTNYKVGPIQFKLDNVDSVTAVTVGTGYYKATATPGGTSCLVLLTPDTSSTLAGITPTDAVIATVTYKSASDATPAIKNDVKSATNPQGTLFAARLEGSKAVNDASFIVGQPATIIGLDGGTTEPPATNVTLTGVKGGFVDEERGYVYGVPQGSNPLTYFSSNGYVELVENAKGETCATGAKLNVYDKQGGTLKQSYTLVIFGDVNGDAEIDDTDSLDIEKLVYYVVEELDLGDVGYFAGDVNGDGETDDTDSLEIEKLVYYVVEDFTVNPHA